MDRLYAGELRIFSSAGEDPDGVAGEAEAAAVHPLYLFADSQLLFWREEGQLFLDRLREHLGPEPPRAAYVGASNGDEPAFYEIFLGAMDGIGIPPRRCRMIPSVPTPQEMGFLASADIVLLAGGDPDRGWRAFAETGLREAVERRYYEGGVLVGVSAGAMQLGLTGWREGRVDPGQVFDTFGLVPFVVDAHAEATDWEDLRRVLAGRGEGARGVGIPRGGGLVLHPDRTVEAVRHPLYEMEARDGGVTCSLVLPAASEA